jgi:hypothetical protein
MMTEEIPADDERLAATILANRALVQSGMYTLSHYNGNHACWDLNPESEMLAIFPPPVLAMIIEFATHVVTTRCEETVLSVSGQNEEMIFHASMDV